MCLFSQLWQCDAHASLLQNAEPSTVIFFSFSHVAVEIDNLLVHVLLLLSPSMCLIEFSCVTLVMHACSHRHFVSHC